MRETLVLVSHHCQKEKQKEAYRRESSSAAWARHTHHPKVSDALPQDPAQHSHQATQVVLVAAMAKRIG